MLCDNCNENEATIQFTEVSEGIRRERHLCTSCAAKIGMVGLNSGSNADLAFVKLLTGLLATSGARFKDEENPIHFVKCPKCGMSYEEFIQIGKFGCADCYDVFGPLVDDNMKKLQGSSIHRGKKYDDNSNLKVEAAKESNSKSKSDKPSVEEMKLKLQNAIEIEDFEAAAKYRDIIRDMEGKKRKG